MDTHVQTESLTYGTPGTEIPARAGCRGTPETLTLEFHRGPYDHKAAAEALLAAGLPQVSALRLLGEEAR